MAATLIADRQHNAFTFPVAGSITPALDDKVALADASNSDANSYATLRTILWEMEKVQARYGYYFLTDFAQETNTTGADEGLVETNSTGSCSQQANDDQGRIGVIRLTTAGSSTGRTALTTGTSIIRLGGGSWWFETSVNVTTLSTSSQRFQLLLGFIDTLTAANQVDGVYFLYDEGGVSTSSTAAAYWQTCTTSNSTRTFNTSLTQTTVTAGQWYRLTIEVNAAANSVTFSIDGATKATHTANIPSATGRQVGYGAFLIKSVGTTARTVDLDWLGAACDFTTAR